MEHLPHLIAILGPTASGKTGRAVSLARAIDAEIVSADSRQVYRRMDLGTGKDIEEYGDIKYHLIDIAEPGTKYDLHRYQQDAHSAIHDITSRRKKVIICGGSGLYAETLLSGIRMADVPPNPELRKYLGNKSLDELHDILATYQTLHNNTDTDSHRRAIRAIEIAAYYKEHPEEALMADKAQVARPPQTIIGIDIPREDRRKRIFQRLEARLKQGMCDEVSALLAEGIKAEDLIYYGLEYKFITMYVTGQITYDEMVNQLSIAIYQFAKRQMTWLRGMERRGFKIHWLDYNLSEEEFVSRALALLPEEFNLR